MNQFHDWGPGDILKIHFLQKSTSCYLTWECPRPPRRLVWRADIRTKHQLLGRFWGENWPASSDFQDVKYILQPSLIILYSCIQSSCIDRNFTLTNTMDRDFVNFALLIKTFYFHWFFELHKWTIVFWRSWAMVGLAESGEWTLSEVARGRKIIKMMFRGNFVSVSPGDWSALCRSGAVIIGSSSDYRPSQGRQSACYEAMATVEYPRLTSASIFQNILPHFYPRVSPS